MVPIERKSVETGGRNLTYYRVSAPRFGLRRLSTDLSYAASDFFHFRHTSNPDVRWVIAVADVVLSDISVPQVLLQSRDGWTRFITLRPLVSYWAATYKETTLKAHMLPPEGSIEQNVMSAFSRWNECGLIVVCMSDEDSTDAAPEPVIVGTMGYLSSFATLNSRGVICASGYSIVNFEECVAPFQAIRDPIGFRAQEGRITNAPAYHRPAMLQTTAGCSMRRIGLKDVEVNVLDRRIAAHSDLPDAVRAYGPSTGVSRTPIRPDGVDIVIVENRAVAVCRFGGTPVPYSGIVLAGSRREFDSRFLKLLTRAPNVEYTLAGCVGLMEGIQCGPTLVENGVAVDLVAQLAEEHFVGADGDLPSAPTALTKSIGSIRAARSAIGTCRGGGVSCLIFEGTNTSASRESPENAFGATFNEVATIACMEGLEQVMALDSGGSVGLYSRGSAVIRSGDGRDSTERRYERPLAHAVLFD